MKTYNPTSKSQRQHQSVDYKKNLTVAKPHKALTTGGKRDAGRNNAGRISVRHKGSGVKRLFRDIDFYFNKKNIPAKIETIEYDPNRTAFIALALYADGERRYILAPKNVNVGDTFIVAENAPLKLGNRLQLKNIPVGTFIHNVAIKPDNKAIIARSAGSYVQVVAQDGDWTHVKSPSSEVRKILNTAFASVGVVSNDENHLVNLGKAGRSRWLGIRPTVRGTAMNPVDHPYGGGEGRQGRGLRYAKTLWGKHVGKGQKSRRAKKYSNKFIVSRRKVGNKKNEKVG